VREGNSTGQMLIVTRETRVINQNDELVALERGQALFY